MTEEFNIPWAKTLEDERLLHVEYPDCGMTQTIYDMAEQRPGEPACVFFGKTTTYRELVDQIDNMERALTSIGVKKGDRITIALPNCPQAVVAFYGTLGIGAIASMIHPLSSEKEIEFYLEEADSKVAITLDQFYPKFKKARANAPLDVLIVTSIKDSVGLMTRVGYDLTEGRKHPKVGTAEPVIFWKDLVKAGREFKGEYKAEVKGEDPATILYSGGTTGTTKGILLKHNNFNALSAQAYAFNPMFHPGDRMLSVMPMFHGFGLGMSIHCMLANGAVCILVPKFSPDSYVKIMMKYRCNLIAGVPTLFDALTRMKSLENADLSFLKGVFSGGDSLTIELKKKIDKFLFDHNSPVPIREGYGLTESVTASCLTIAEKQREGSIGFPMPDMLYKIVKPGTIDEVPYGETGEICISGPSIMIGYVKHEEETKQALQTHADGRTWLHTGDLGVIDSDGYVYFKQRLKRMIITNGYNVYPSNMENILDANPLVHSSCVIGIPDKLRGQMVKAFIMLEPGVPPIEETKAKIMEYAKENIAKYALPREIEFRSDLPKTAIGKVAYRILEEEELKKIAERMVNSEQACPQA